MVRKSKNQKKKVLLTFVFLGAGLLTLGALTIGKIALRAFLEKLEDDDYIFNEFDVNNYYVHNGAHKQIDQ